MQHAFVYGNSIMKYILKSLCINYLKGTNSPLSWSGTLQMEDQCPMSEKGLEQSIDKL